MPKSSKKHIHVAAALIMHRGKLLITRRPEGRHFEGMWEFPGGKLESNESLRQCLKREIREELGMDVSVNRRILTVQQEYDERIVTLNFFECACFRGSPKSLEGQEVLWVDLEDLRQYPFPPPDEKIIETLIAQKKHGYCRR